MMFCADKCLCGSSVFSLVPSKRGLKYVLVVGAVCSNPTQREYLFICLFLPARASDQGNVIGSVRIYTISFCN